MFYRLLHHHLVNPSRTQRSREDGDGIWVGFVLEENDIVLCRQLAELVRAGKSEVDRYL